MFDIDKWFADKCGIVFNKSRDEFGIDIDIKSRITNLNIVGDTIWSIQDPRCMEVIREKFKIETLYGYAEESWFAESERKADKGRGKTIEDAEIATCKAIYEARDD